MVAGIVFIGIAKLVGLAKEIVMAWRFGSGPIADAYALTFSLASWPAAVWSSVATVLIVPIMVAARRGDPMKLDLLQRELLAIAILTGILLAALVFGILQFSLINNWLGLAPDRAAEVSHMVGPLSLAVPLSTICSVLAAWLIASQRQISTLLEGAPSLLLLGLLLSLPAVGAVDATSASWIAWGTLAGFAAQLVLLAAVQERPSLLLRPSLSFRSNQWPGLARGLTILVLSQALISMSGLIDQVSVASLGPTSNSTINYASRLIFLVQSLASLAIVRALLPILSNDDYGDDRARWRIALSWSLPIFAAGLLISLAGWFLAPFGVSVLFQRGDFSAEDTVRVSEAVRYGLVQIPFFGAGIVLAQYIAATKRYSLFLWGNVLNLIVKVSFNALLIPHFGAPGAMLATAFMYMASMIFLWIFGRPQRPPALVGEA